MAILRVTQHIEQEDNYRIHVELRDEDGSAQTAEARFAFQLTPSDRADLRWYLEDYLQYPMDPAPEIAARVEARMRDLGVELFRNVFQANDDARDLWATLRAQLDDTRVEIVTDVKGATALPWELLLDPKTEAVLALRARAFVRAYLKAVQKAEKAKSAEKVRILLVICRPGGDADVPFRSVAGQLLKGLSAEVRETFDLSVLRPPTFEQLSKTLQQAKLQGRPYHIVHFDGHGGYFDVARTGGGAFSRLFFGDNRPGQHGYLAFENPKADENLEWVDGPRLGKLLVESDAPVLVLNACRSAHAAPLDAPDVARDVNEAHSQVRAFGSLAQDVMDAGVAGVVAMRYNVYVVTAAQFVADLYAALVAGHSLGEAVSLGRKQLAAQPLREIAFEPRSLQDWSVPVVYEAAPIQLFAKPVGATPASPLQIDLSQDAKPADDLPRPEVGFFGRDETLLALDRAYDTQQIVLLHAYAGSGKTMTVAEFARWYQQTGGLQGAILFTTFEVRESGRPITLELLLEQFEEFFRDFDFFQKFLAVNKIQWGASTKRLKKNAVLGFMNFVPVLWIWDNVEPVNGFPKGTPSNWTETQQQELKDFLMDAQETKAKFLLTSRRAEREWLGDLPRRVSLPPMPMQEMVQLARALAEKTGFRITDVEDWRPLLRFTQGNPLTLTVVVVQALQLVTAIKDPDEKRQKKKRTNRLQEYLEQLRRGESAFPDEAAEGRSKSLGASLSYGFETAFNEDERKILALLHFFQGFVDVNVLRHMGNLKTLTGEDYSLPELANLQPATFNTLLDKTAEIGLLTPHGRGTYTIHPALPWFFKTLFGQSYPDEIPLSSSFILPPSSLAARAFVESLGELGNYYQSQYERGNRNVIAALRAEEANLLHARALARQNEWWDGLISTMQGLDTLYDHTGRRAEWRRLVEEIVPDFVGADDLPLPGREEQWSLVTQYRVLLAKESRDWPAAERLQRVQVDEQRRRAAALLARPPEGLAANEKNSLRTLGASLEQLGHIQREQSKDECVKSYQESIPIYQLAKASAAEAVAAFNLGHAYKDLPALRDLDAAEGWYQRSLALRAKNDRIGIGVCLDALGSIAYNRYRESKNIETLNDALRLYHQAVDMFPPEAVNNLAVSHNQLGNIYNDAGDLERALEHYNQAIKFCEVAGNYFNAGLFQENVAIAIAPQGRIDDALLYASAATKSFSHYGDGAAQAIQKVQRTIAWIEQMRKK